MIDDRDILRHLEEGGADVFDRPEPPALDLDAIVGSSAAPRRRARTWSFRPVVALGGAVACLGVGLLVGAVAFGGDDTITPGPDVRASTPPTATTPPTIPGPSRQVELARFGDAAPADASAEVNVFTTSDGKTVDLRVRGMPQPRRGEFYELWVLGDAGKMISLGIVRVDANGSADVRLPLPVSRKRFPVFDLSLEPGDGDPTHSGQSMLRSAGTA